jgi:hypothetical protein
MSILQRQHESAQHVKYRYSTRPKWAVPLLVGMIACTVASPTGLHWAAKTLNEPGLGIAEQPHHVAAHPVVTVTASPVATLTPNPSQRVIVREELVKKTVTQVVAVTPTSMPQPTPAPTQTPSPTPQPQQTSQTGGITTPGSFVGGETPSTAAQLPLVAVSPSTGLLGPSVAGGLLPGVSDIVTGVAALLGGRP